MKDYPLVTRLLCVGLVAALMLPLGRMLFPMVALTFDHIEFSAIEAVVSATLGYGLYAAIFG